MDIFSVGCVIAEIFLGHRLFDLAMLQRYRKGQIDIHDLLKSSKPEDQEPLKLIKNMLDLDPSKRLPIRAQIEKWNDLVFARSFKNIFFYIGSAFQRPSFLYSDEKIGLVRKYLPAIWRSCFGKEVEGLYEPLEPSLFQKLEDFDLEVASREVLPGHEIIPLIFDQKGEPKIVDVESIVIVIHWIGTLAPSCFLPSSKMVALEIFSKIAEETSVDLRLQFILPYV